MGDKIFYTMGEVSEMFDLSATTFRFWEEQFPTLRPKRNKKGNRLYTADDVETLKKIYHLVKERGLKIEAAKKQLRHSTTDDFDRNVELVERLRHIRTMLQDIKEELKEEKGEEVVSGQQLMVNEESPKEIKVIEAEPKPFAVEQLLF